MEIQYLAGLPPYDTPGHTSVLDAVLVRLGQSRRGFRASNSDKVSFLEQLWYTAVYGAFFAWFSVSLPLNIWLWVAAYRRRYCQDA